MGFWDAVESQAARRALGAFNIAFGIVLGWVVFVAL